MADKPKHAAIYVRVASSRPDNPSRSIELQQQRCQELAAKHGWTVAEVYTDHGSARSPRTDYQRMLDDITAGTRDAIITYDADRIARNPGDWERFQAAVNASGISHLVTVTGGDMLGDTAVIQRALQSLGHGDRTHPIARRGRTSGND